MNMLTQREADMIEVQGVNTQISRQTIHSKIPQHIRSIARQTSRHVIARQTRQL